MVTRAIAATTALACETDEIIRSEDIAARFRPWDQHLPGSNPAILLHQWTRWPDLSETGRPSHLDIDVRLISTRNNVTDTLGVDRYGFGLFGPGAVQPVRGYTPP